MARPLCQSEAGMRRYRKHLQFIAIGLVSLAALSASGCTGSSSRPTAPKAVASTAAKADPQPSVQTQPCLRIDFDGDIDDRGVPAPWTPRVSSGTLDVRVEADPELK